VLDLQPQVGTAGSLRSIAVVKANLMLDYSFLLTYASVLCRCRSSSYDPFLDLSVPIHKGESEQPKTLLGSFKISSGSVETNKSTLEKCLGIFTGRTTASAPTRSRFTLSPCDAIRYDAL